MADEGCVIDAPITVKLVSGVIAPIAPPKETAPAVPPLMVTAAAPLSVLENVTLAPAALPPAFVLSNVGDPLTRAGPVIAIAAPLVVTLPPTLIAADPV